MVIELKKGKRWEKKPGIVSGVCQGLADALDVDPWLVRLLWVVSMLWFGFGFLFYLLLAFFLPRARTDYEDQRKILGVSLKIAHHWGIDYGVVRAVFLLAALLTGFVPVAVIYLVLFFILPENKDYLYY